MSMEDDYGMIDGTINNGSRDEVKEKPSIRERLAEAKRECAERPTPEKGREGRSTPEHGYRNRLGLSQEAIAFRTGLHRTYISAVERGKRSISLDNIQKIADALEIETYLLFVDYVEPNNNIMKGDNKSCHV